MYLNGFRVVDATCITVTLENNDPLAYVNADGIAGYPQLGAYLQAGAANIADALSAFIAGVGYPWITVGSLSSMPWQNGTHGILAVNLDHSGFSMADMGTGIKFYGVQPADRASFGYAPWNDFASAEAAIKAMQGNISWTPSS